MLPTATLAQADAFGRPCNPRTSVGCGLNQLVDTEQQNQQRRMQQQLEDIQRQQQAPASDVQFNRRCIVRNGITYCN
jgi:hypothetical protein